MGLGLSCPTKKSDRRLTQKRHPRRAKHYDRGSTSTFVKGLSVSSVSLWNWTPRSRGRRKILLILKLW